MIRINLGGTLILKETLRTTDREKNAMYIFLATQPLYGVQFTSDLAAASVKYQLEITAAKNLTLWNVNKDASQQQMVQNIYDFMAYYYPEMVKYFAWVDAAVKETIDNPIPNGDPITQLIPYSDPRIGGNQGLIDQLKAEVILGSDFMLFRQLYDIGVRTFTLETISE